jgi:acyl-CoA thioester hydrolase
MPKIYEHAHTILSEEIDSLGHANNVAFLEWLLAAAVAHSAAQGWPGPRYRALGQGWVVRAHAIEYLAPGFVGQQVVVRTWVATMKKATSLRRYQVIRPADGALLATAETRWAFIDYRTGQPVRVPAEVAEAFEVVES